MGACWFWRDAPPSRTLALGFDGTYVGTSVRTRGGNDWCGPDTAPDSLTVGAGRFRYPFPIVAVTTVGVQVQLRADGSFSGSAEYFDSAARLGEGRMAWATVVGHIAGATLDAQVESRTCGRHLSFRRR